MSFNNPFIYKAPKLSFTREAMVFNTVKFVVSGYDRKINNLRNWKLNIDFGNGFVFIPYGGTTITVTYAAGASPTIKYIGEIDPINPWANDDTDSEEGSKAFFIKTPTNPIYQKPDKIWRINAGSFTPPTYAAQSYAAGSDALKTSDAVGNAYIKLGAGHTQISKPIIFVDGIDFDAPRLRFVDNEIVLNSNYESRTVRCGVTGWDLFSMGAEDSWIDPLLPNETYREYPKMFDDLTSQGYDIIFLDFEQGATYIQKNAMVLKALINRINATKVTDVNGLHENVLVGCSMGGQVARMALTQMERDKQPHCTRMYVSFDSPQKGANVPLSVQGLSYMAREILPENWESLNQPAAKQMLIETLQDAVVKGKLTVSETFDGLNLAPNFRPNTLRPVFMQEMKDLGYPVLAQNIAIVDGDIKGTNVAGDPTSTQPNGVPFPSGASMMGVFAAPTGTPIMTARLNALNGTTNVAGLPNGTIFSGTLPNICLLSNITAGAYTVRFTLNQTLPNFDNAPGCIRGDMRGLRRQITDLQATLDNKIGSPAGQALISFPANQFQPNYCFMSTTSTLDIRNPNNPDEWNWNVNPSILGVNIKDLKLKTANTNLTPFFDFFAPEKNLRHVEVDVEMRGWVKQYMIDTDKDALTLNKVLPYNGFNSYNYSYRKNRISTVTVNTGGVLKVNDIGNSGLNNPNNLDKINYEAQLGGECSGATVTINGGSFLIGSPTETTRTATVSVGTGNTIIVNSGTMNIYNGSKMIVNTGGQLFMNGGAASLKDGSQIIIKRGGQLTIKSGASVGINGNSQIIVEVGGTLIIEKGTSNNVQFSGAGNVLIKGELIVNAPIKMNGTAYFDFAQSHKLTLLSTFDLRGQDKNTIMINLQKSTTLSLKNQDIVFANGGIIYGEGTKIQMPSQKTVYFGSINFEASPDDNIFTTGLTNQNSISPTSITINGCTFLNLARDIELVHNDVSQSPASIDITGSAFIDYKKFGILLDKSLRMNVTGSSFSTASTNGGYQSSIELGLLGLPSNFPPAIIARDVPAIIDLSSCEVAGNDAAIFQEAYEAYMSDPKTIDNTHACKILFDDDASDANAILNGFNYAIYLQNVPHFYLTHGTTIHDAFTGIYARGKSNVIMRQGAALIKNGIGVNMIGEPKKINGTLKKD